MYPIKNEMIRIYNTQTKLNPPTGYDENKLSAWIAVTHGGMKFTLDGSNPSSDGAFSVRVGDVVKLHNIFEIKQINMIHDSTCCDCWLSITYFLEEK